MPRRPRPRHHDCERCFYCEMYLSSRHEHDHFPVRWSYGGEGTVPVCVNCHDLKDRVHLDNWPILAQLNGFDELFDALVPRSDLETEAKGPMSRGFPAWFSAYLQWPVVEKKWPRLSPIARVLYGKLAVIDELRRNGFDPAEASGEGEHQAAIEDAVSSPTLRVEDPEDAHSSAGHSSGGQLAICHVMRANEDFEKTADMLFQLVRKSSIECPGTPRRLYLDVEGHRARNRAFDHDSFEIMTHFVIGFLSPWLTEVHTPLLAIVNGKPQREDIPDGLFTIPNSSNEGREAMLAGVAQENGSLIFDADTRHWIGLNSTDGR